MSSADAIAVSVVGGTAQRVAGWRIRATGEDGAHMSISRIAVSMFEETGGKARDWLSSIVTRIKRPVDPGVFFDAADEPSIT